MRDTRVPLSSSKHLTFQLLLAAFLTALLAACGVSRPAEPEPAAAELVIEFRSAGVQSADGDDPAADAVVSGPIRISVRQHPLLEEVRFHLDDEARTAAPAGVATSAPFELALDTTGLADGLHTVTAVAELRNGREQVKTSEFYVANATGGELPVGAEPPVERPAPEEQPAPDAPAPDAPVEPAPVEEAPAEDAPADDAPVVTDPVEEPGDDAGTVPAPNLPAATLWVAPDGSGDGRSPSSPTSISRAAGMVGPGDVVHLRGGVYDIGVRFTRSGTADRPIVWTSYPGEWAVFDGSRHTPISSSAKFHVQGARYNTFTNLEVRNGPQEGIWVDGAHDNVFRNIVTHGHQYSGIGNYGSDRNLYEGITTYDNYDDHNPRGLYGDDADGIALSSGDRNVVRRVVTYNNSDDGIDAWRSTNTIIEYVVAYGNGRGSHGNGNGIKAGGNSEQNDTIVRHSIAFDNKANGFDDNSGKGILFENNTAYGNGGYSFMGGSTTTRRNNIAVGGTVGMWGARDTNNTWNLGIRDPRFASTTYGDAAFLTLASDSPARGAGAGGVDLGAIPSTTTYAEMIGPRVVGAIVGAGTLAAR